MRITFSLWTFVLLVATWCSGPALGTAAKATPKATKAAQATTTPKPEVSVFKDKQLEAAVRKYVFEKRDTDKPVTADDVAKISTLEAKGLGISDLTGLEHCRSLAALDLADNQIANLGPIKNLPLLQTITLSNNRIEDISPLGTLKALQYIELSSNRVKDVRPLAGLTNMAALYLSTNQITDISPVLKLPRLSSLYLDHNQIKDIQGMGGLHTLSSLSLSDNRIVDIAPLNGLNGLYHLFLERNRITNLRPLADMMEKDDQGEKRFAPFINVYLSGNPLKGFFRSRKDLDRMEKCGARIHK